MAGFEVTLHGRFWVTPEGTVVIFVPEHINGNVVMQFDMPDAQEVGAACGTENRR